MKTKLFGSDQQANPKSPFYEELLGLKAEYSGPNCWNATFHAQNVYPYKIMISRIQVSQLFSHLNCSQIKFHEKKHGDIVRYFNKKGLDSHTAIYLGNDRYFQKLNNSNQSKYEIANLKSIESVYGFKASCEYADQCDYKRLFFRCQSNNFDFFKAKNIFERKLDTIAKLMSILAFDGNAKPELFNEIIAETESLKDLILSTPDDFSSWIDVAQRSWLNLFADLGAQAYMLQQDFNTEELNTAYLAVEKSISSLNWIYADTRIEKNLSTEEYQSLLTLLTQSTQSHGNATDILHKLRPAGSSIAHQTLDLLANTYINFENADSFISDILSQETDFIRAHLFGIASVLDFSASKLHNYEAHFSKAIRYVPTNSKYVAVAFIEALIYDPDPRLSKDSIKHLLTDLIQKMDPKYGYGQHTLRINKQKLDELGIKLGK